MDSPGCQPRIWRQISRDAGMITSGSFNGRDSCRVGRCQGRAGPGPVALQPLTPADSPAFGEGMNDPEVTMSNAATNTNLIAHTKALEAAGIAIKLVMRVPAPLKPIADQVIRSATSVPANLAEGHGRVGRDRSNHWRIAYASAKEVDSHLKLLAHAGAISQTAARDVMKAFDQVRAMTWRLLNPRS